MEILFHFCLFSKERIAGITDLMAVIIIVVLVAENAVMRDANLMAFLVIMHGSEQAFAAISDFMTVFIVMVRIAEQCSPAMSNLMPVFIIMICAVGQNALATKKLFHIDLRLSVHRSFLKRPYSFLNPINHLVKAVPCIIDSALNHYVTEEVVAKDIQHRD